MAFVIDAIGPTVVRTYTFPDADATILTSANAVTAAQGGTGQTSYAVGDLLYATGSTTLAKRAVGAAGTVLVGGTTPDYSATPSVTSLAASSYVAVGNPAGPNYPAASGAIRIPNNSAVYGRNAANTSDLPLIHINASDYINFGDSNTNAVVFHAASWAVTFSSAGSFYPSPDNTLLLGNTGLRWGFGYFGQVLSNDGYYEGTEMAAPAAPAANKGRLYFDDNGSGKTRLMCVFNTGAAQQVAIQP